MANGVTIYTSGIRESGIVELIGKDEQIAATNYSASVGIGLPADISGEILSILLISYESGSGTIQTPGAKLFLFDADPEISANDTTLSAAGAEHKTLIAAVEVLSGEWFSTDNGAVWYKRLDIPFHKINNIYASLRLDAGATTINSAAGDDEVIEMNLWYRRDA